MRFAEKALSDIHAGANAVAAEIGGYVGERVEGAVRHRAMNVRKLVERSDAIVAQLLVRGAHVGDEFLRAIEGGDRSFLRDGADARRRLALQLHHLVYDRLGREGESGTPSGHAVCLRERADEDHVLFCGMESSGADAVVFGTVVEVDV